MDRFGEWRPIEAAADPEADRKPAAVVEVKASAGASDIRFAGLLGAGVVLAVGVFVWITMSRPVAGVELSGQAEFLGAAATATARPAFGGVVSAVGAQETSATLTVDVEGAVVAPGLHRLAGGSRVGDAIAAAGGYSALIDIAAAAASLNLAQPLSDGAKVHVPVRGEAAAAPDNQATDAPSNPGGGGGLINVNTASADELDTLPGIGPVTADKIIAAREEAPFASVDELLSREIVGASTFEKIRELVTTGP